GPGRWSFHPGFAGYRSGLWRRRQADPGRGRTAKPTTGPAMIRGVFFSYGPLLSETTHKDTPWASVLQGRATLRWGVRHKSERSCPANRIHPVMLRPE